ncbi:hypothetical protein ABI59_02340 [Acidobacteria bacterium Mor1]|nr:hypothetical protein ABI59_02340 [Acidobacteria bacterium Mor1]
MDRRLLLFAKRPRAGRVKTRMTPPLSREQAVELYSAFLLDQLEFLAALSGEFGIELWTDGPWEPAAPFDRVVEGMPRFDQGEGDLGRRLHRAFARAFDGGAEQVVVIGADSPTLPPRHVHRAFDQLGGHDAVIAPADDGGYVLLGSRQLYPELFGGISWGGAAVFAETRSAARSASISLAAIEGWHDVDDVEGLRRLREELADEAATRRAPATRVVLDSLVGTVL